MSYHTEAICVCGLPIVKMTVAVDDEHVRKAWVHSAELGEVIRRHGTKFEAAPRQAVEVEAPS